jgi:uncharacterized NAD(P)/FAD-binding protein YdhS
MIATCSASGVMLRQRSTVVVLCIGNLPPTLPCETVGQLDHPRYIADPWHEPQLADIPTEAPVAIIGIGLTAVDVVLSLLDQEHKGPIVALSRRGLLPHRHVETRQYHDFMADEPAPESLLRLFARLRSEIREAEAGGFDWRSVIDAFRSHTERCWRALSEAERRRFLRHVRPYWEIHRHRMAPHAAERLWDAFRHGQLVRRKGRLMAIAEDGAGLVLSYLSRDGRMHHLRAAHVINSSGPQFDVGRLDHPLVASVLQQGLARPDPLGLGLEVTSDFRVVGTDGNPTSGLLALGPIALGGCWESTAVPELRIQCAPGGKHARGAARGRARLKTFELASERLMTGVGTCCLSHCACCALPLATYRSQNGGVRRRRPRRGAAPPPGFHRGGYPLRPRPAASVGMRSRLFTCAPIARWQNCARGAKAGRERK